MLIFSFDCAAKNLGICVCRFNQNWETEMMEHINNINVIKSNLSKLDDITQINIMKDIFNIINNFISNIFKVVWYNTADLMPNVNIKKKITTDLTVNLKALLNYMDIFGKPDLVLIEHQMKLNDISRILSYQIMYHYTVPEQKYEFKLPNLFDIFYNVHKNNIMQNNVNCNGETNNVNDNNNRETNNTNNANGTNDNNNIQNNTNNANNANDKRPLIKVLACNIKNSVSFTEEGRYYNFIEKYSNYTANKKHTTYNFRYYLEKVDDMKYPKKIKLDDCADAFMMIVGCLKNCKLI